MKQCLGWQAFKPLLTMRANALLWEQKITQGWVDGSGHELMPQHNQKGPPPQQSPEVTPMQTH